VTKRVMAEAVSWDDDLVAFEKAIGFVSRKEEFVDRFLDANCGPSCHLFPVLEGNIVRKSHFSQSEEAEETCLEHSDEKEIIMECGGRIVVDNCVKVIDCESAFSDGGCSHHSRATLECTTYEDRVSAVFDTREAVFKLLRDTGKVSIDGSWVDVVAHVDSEK
jgi:hypothetical protein